MKWNMQDEALLVQCAQEDPREFVALYDRYVARIYAYAQRETGDPAVAQDIVSATFEKALRKMPDYQWRGTSFGAWLYQIARNEILTYFRKQKRLFPLSEWLFGSGSVELVVQAEQERDELVQAMRRLSPKDQELLRLRYYERLSHREIGEILGKSSRTIAVAVHRALKRLRQRMEAVQEVALDVPAR
jgi:RNA polymerase sigma-70 factor (ECF subfamily)